MAASVPPGMDRLEGSSTLIKRLRFSYPRKAGTIIHANPFAGMILLVLASGVGVCADA